MHWSAGHVWSTPILALAEPAQPDWRELTVRPHPLDYDGAIAMFARLQRLLDEHRGDMRVVLEMPDSGGGVRRIPTKFFVRPSRQLITEVKRKAGNALDGIALMG